MEMSQDYYEGGRKEEMGREVRQDPHMALETTEWKVWESPKLLLLSPQERHFSNKQNLMIQTTKVKKKDWLSIII